MSAQENMALARRIYDLFNQGQLAEDDLLANDNVVIELVPFGQTFQGHEGWMEFMLGFKRAFPDLTITIEHQFASDDHVVNECSWVGTHTGPLSSPAGDIPPTGKSVKGARFCEVWHIENGKLSHLTNYQDTATWLRQLGLVP